MVHGGAGNGFVSGIGARPLTPDIYFGMAGRAPTDITRVPNGQQQMHLYDQKLEGQITTDVEEEEELAEGTVMANNSFDTETLSYLASTGVIAGPGSGGNFFNLARGKVLFSPKKNIIVKTHEANVFIAANSHVWIVETGADVAICDLSDTHAGAVKVISKNRQLDLHPGLEVVLTRDTHADLDKVNPVPEIAYRNVRSEKYEDGIKAFIAEFSIISALNNVNFLHRIATSDIHGHQKIASVVMKNAAILSLITNSKGSYKLSKTAVVAK